MFKYTIRYSILAALIHSNGFLTVTFINYGATLVSCTCPDKRGVVEVILFRYRHS